MINKDELKQKLTGQWHQVISALCPGFPLDKGLKHQPCPGCGSKDNFRLLPDFNETGSIWCHTCFNHGQTDGIGAVGWFNNWDFKETIEALAPFVGMEENARECTDRAFNARECTRELSQKKIHDDARTEEKSLTYINKIRKNTVQDHPRLTAYLAHRGLKTNSPAIGLHPGLGHNCLDKIHRYEDAMIVKITDSQNKVIGIQRTYLSQNGDGKSEHQANKMTLGKSTGGAVRLGPEGAIMAFCEGVESAMSVMEAKQVYTWAALGGLANLVVPDGCDVVMCFADNDEAGIKSATEFCKKAHEAGKAVYFAFPPNKGEDWNDIYKRDGEITIEPIFFSAEEPTPFNEDEDYVITDEEWPEPKPLMDLPPVKEFDLDMLPERFKEYVKDEAYHMDCPLDFVGAPLMSSVGAIIGAKLAIQPKAHNPSWLEFPNPWCLLVGKAGSQKSPGMGRGRAGIVHLEKEANKDYFEKLELFKKDTRDFKLKKAALETKIKAFYRDDKEHEAEQLTQALKGQSPFLEPPTRYVISDITPERIITMQEFNTNGLQFYRDELSILFKQFNKQGYETLRGILLEAFDGKESKPVDRQKDHSFVQALRNLLTLCGGLQPKLLAKILDEDDNEDGLMARFQLCSFPDIPLEYNHVDEEPNFELFDELIEFFEELSEIETSGKYPNLPKGPNESNQPRLKFDAEAQKEFDNWIVNHMRRIRSDEVSGAMVSHLDKFRKFVPVMALIISVCDYGLEDVNLQSFLKALKWAEYAESHANRIYSLSGSPEMTTAKIIVEMLEEGKAEDGFTARDFYRSHKSLPQGEGTVKALQILCDLDYLKKEKIKTGGRGSEVFYINPKISTRKRDKR